MQLLSTSHAQNKKIKKTHPPPSPPQKRHSQLRNSHGHSPWSEAFWEGSVAAHLSECPGLSGASEKKAQWSVVGGRAAWRGTKGLTVFAAVLKTPFSQVLASPKKWGFHKMTFLRYSVLPLNLSFLAFSFTYAYWLITSIYQPCTCGAFSLLHHERKLWWNSDFFLHLTGCDL